MKFWGKKTFFLLALILIAIPLIFARLNEDFIIFTDELTIEVSFRMAKTNNFSTPIFRGQVLLEKPPLYFWSAMASVGIFGINEFALRLPSVLFGLLSLWLIWHITKNLTNSKVATIAFLVLLFSAPFYYFSREVRLDSGVVMAMLLTLFVYAKGLQNKKYLVKTIIKEIYINTY